jgi:ATP-dependent Clp protease ATP-binding subunit ClpB
VFNTLLQLLDDGRLTDGHGRTVNFKNTVVIMTSNIGSHYIMELGPEAAEPKVMETLRQHFRPEFLNRIDDIIMFHGLSRSDLARIVDIQLAHLRKLLAERKITLELTEAAQFHLAEAGYDPTFGARPLKRVIQRELQDPLALRLLQGDFKEGDIIRVDVKNGALKFEKAQTLAVEPVVV